MKTIYNRRLFNVASGSQSQSPLIKADSNECFVEEYLAWKRSYSKSAHLAYRLWVTRFQSFANKPPEALTHGDYVAFAASIQGGHAPRGIEFALNVVHNYLRFFAEQGKLTFPMYLVRVPKAPSNSHAAITEGEYRSIIEAMKTGYP